MAEAQALVAKLRSGDYGLKDGSQAGDWRLPTTIELDSTTDANTFKYFKPFLAGWPAENTSGYSLSYSRGYVSVDQKFPKGLTFWGPDNDGDCGRDTTQWGKDNQGDVWPVRSSARKTSSVDAQPNPNLKPSHGSATLQSSFIPARSPGS